MKTLSSTLRRRLCCLALLVSTSLGLGLLGTAGPASASGNAGQVGGGDVVSVR
ncbi:MAG: hypothetical protein M3063_08680 [Actinomycetota bacterium]|nr:hypothetical protein [Actinomycetota bacterium]